jgi:putative metalloprotease
VIVPLCLVLGAWTSHAWDLGKSLDAAGDAVKGASLSDADARSMALQAVGYMDKKNKVAPATNPYAKRLKALVASSSSENGLPLNYKVYVVKDVNAFSTADGSVRVFSGLMDMMTDDELRFVIGHEIGHVALGHSKKKLQVAYSTKAAREGASAAGGTAGVVAESQLGGFAEALVNAQFSQSEELAADKFGLQFMKAHGYPATAGPSALRKLGNLNDKSSFLASHPAPADRAAKLEKML